MSMPSRNVVKIDTENTYYHVYSRGINKDALFDEPEDYAIFLNLLKRYLGTDQLYDKYGVPYLHIGKKVELLCYCLMPNHFHLLLFQTEKGSMTQLMRGLMTSYSSYFNKKRERRGPVFESCYKASSILNDSYLTHITRYIHLNPKQYKTYKYSSLPYYLQKMRADWINPHRILVGFKDTKDYVSFMDDYEDVKNMYDQIKYELADTTTLTP